MSSFVATTTVLFTIVNTYARLRNAEHEVKYFRAVKCLSDVDLASFSADFESVLRVASSAYGLHLFGKVKIPATSDAYIHIRIFENAKDRTGGNTWTKENTRCIAFILRKW